MKARTVAASVAERLASAGIEMAGFEAELLVRQAAGVSREEYFGGADLQRSELARLSELLERRLRREPQAYLAGEREFYGLTFEVGPDVLIPRPETELLVDLARIEARERPGISVADIGTGSGCVAVAVAHSCPSASVVAFDISLGALAVAGRNAARHGGRVALARADLASAVRRADVILANLPYIPTGEVDALEPEIRDWEPRVAVDGGVDGLSLLRRLVADCERRLQPRLLALEVAYGQARTVANLLAETGAATATVKDLGGIERVVTGRWPAW